MRKLVGFIVGLLMFAFAFEAQANDSSFKRYYYVDSFRLLELVPFGVVKVLFLYNEFKNVDAKTFLN